MRNKISACCVLKGKPEERRNIKEMVLKGIRLAEVDCLCLYEDREELHCCSRTVFILVKTGKVRVVLCTLRLCEDRKELRAVVDCLHLNEERKQLQAVVMDCPHLDEGKRGKNCGQLWTVFVLMKKNNSCRLL
jgi:hypothetical protein